MVFFHNHVLRGNRSTKADSDAFDAFQSPNMDPLATLKINIKGYYDAYIIMEKITTKYMIAVWTTQISLLRKYSAHIIRVATLKSKFFPLETVFTDKWYWSFCGTSPFCTNNFDQYSEQYHPNFQLNWLLRGWAIIENIKRCLKLL